MGAGNFVGLIWNVFRVLPFWIKLILLFAVGILLFKVLKTTGPHLMQLAVLAWLVHAAPVQAQNDSSPLDDPTGFWLVAEAGPPVNQGIASIPLLGLAVRAQIGNPRAIWEIRRPEDGMRWRQQEGKATPAAHR